MNKTLKILIFALVLSYANTTLAKPVDYCNFYRHFDITGPKYIETTIFYHFLWKDIDPNIKQESKIQVNNEFVNGMFIDHTDINYSIELDANPMSVICTIENTNTHFFNVTCSYYMIPLVSWEYMPPAASFKGTHNEFGLASNRHTIGNLFARTILGLTEEFDRYFSVYKNNCTKE